MSLAQLLTLDTDTIRFLLVMSVVVGAAVYARWFLAAGGTLTGGYLVLLVLLGEWELILAMLCVTWISYWVVKVVMTRHFALPKVWLFCGFVVISAVSMAVITMAFRSLGTIDLPFGTQFALISGSYITPGLIAYDLAHQGLRPTMIGMTAVFGGTLLVAIPVLMVANVLHPESSLRYVPGYGNIPPGLFWLATLASVFICVALRLSFAARAGGFIGPLFITEMLSWQAMVTITSAALVAYVITRHVNRVILLTPRQRFQVSLVMGMMCAWTGLYWGARVGWMPALAANSYALEPLLAVGLLAAEMGRRGSSVLRTLSATAVAVAFITLVLYAATSDAPQSLISTPLLLLGVPAVLLLPAILDLRAAWHTSVSAGRGVVAAWTQLESSRGVDGRGS